MEEKKKTMGRGVRLYKKKMSDELLDARIVSRILDGMKAEDIFRETIEDCGGDKMRATTRIRDNALKMM